MRRLLLVMLLSVYSCASTHYVSSSNPGAADSGSGSTVGAPWKTLAYTMAHVAAGDSVLLNRGDVWNEPLVISQNNLTIDAYPAGGIGPAPRITGYQALGGWSVASGNVYKATMSGATSCSTSYANVYFGGVAGQLATASSGAGSPAHDRDFYCDGASPSTVYVYAASTPSSYYGSVVVVTPSNSALLDTNGKTGLSVQHLALDYFDNYGVYVHGGSTNLTFANMSINGMVVGENRQSASTPGYKPYGLYVSNAGYATNLSIYNVDAHLNFDGFRFDGYAAGSTITMVGCRGFANREAALNDNSGSATSAVTYSSSHFYASAIGSIGSTDVIATAGLPVDGGGNIAKDTAPVIQGLNRFPAVFSYTVDDVLMSGSGSTGDAYWTPAYPDTEDYIDLLTPVFNARGVKMNMAAVAGFAATGQYSFNASQLANWLTQGHEIESHSWSHEYYTGIGDSTSSNNLFSLQYVGSGTAATMTITGYPNSVLATTVTGATGQNLSLNLSTAPYDTVAALKNYFAANWAGVYTFTPKTIRTGNGGPVAPTHTVVADDIASAVDIKTSAYVVTHGNSTNSWARFWTDEVKTSENWLKNSSGIAGLTSVPVMVYPGGWNTATSDGMLASYGYAGGRGEIGMHPAGHTNASGCSQTCTPKYASDQMFAGRGVDGLNIISLSPAPWHGQTRAQIDAEVGALVFKAKAWGLPIGLFSHNVDLLTPAEIGWIVEGILSRGGQIKKNSELVSYIETAGTGGAGSGVYVDATTNYAQYVQPATGPYPSMRTAAFSPDAKAEPYISATYGLDILGNSRGTGIWDIGAYQSALWGTTHGAAGTGKSATYGRASAAYPLGENAYCGAGDVANFGGTDGPATLPTACTYTAMAGTRSAGNTWTVNASNCNDASTGLQASLNNAAAGDTIVIPATATCTGNYTFPAKAGADINHWITVRTDQIANAGFPAEGVQATPCQIGITALDTFPNYSCPTPAVLMPTIQSNATNAATISVSGKFYRFVGLNITKTPSVTIAGVLVALDGSDHVIFDRVLVHGVEPTDFHTKAGFSMRGTHQAIISSWIYDIDWNQAEGYALSGGTGLQADEGPIKLYNNLLQGASETWIFGGGAAVAQPHDLEFRRNLSIHPLKHYSSVASEGVSRVNVKNNGELKNATRILYEENVAWGSWQGQSDQPGSMWLITPSAQGQFDNGGTQYVNVSGTTVSCASDASGTACAVGSGWFGVNITSGSRASNVVTLNWTAGSHWQAGSPQWWSPPYHVVVQGLTGACAAFNGEQVVTNNATNGVTQFTVTGSDIASCGSTAGAIITDLLASTCPPNGCRFWTSTAPYPRFHIVSVQDTEHMTVAENLGTVTGSNQRTCHPGLAPQASVTNMTVRYSYMTHAAAVGLGPTNGISDCGDENHGGAYFSFHDIVWDDIDASFWTNEKNACCAGGTGAGPRMSQGFLNPAAWQHDVSYSHISGMGLRTWSGGGLGAGGFVVIDALYQNLQPTCIQRTANVATLTLSTNFAVGNAIQVSGFTGTYASFNGTNLVLTAVTTTTLSFASVGSDIPLTAVSSGGTGQGFVNPWPFSYYKNLTFKDSFFTAPFNWDKSSGNVEPGGAAGGFATNACDPYSLACTWNWTNMVMATAMYAGYTQSSSAPYPTTNPDSSPTCTVAGGCSVTDFSNAVNLWNGAMGNVLGNDYHVKMSSPFYHAATDGKDIGADINHVNAVVAAVLPSFTFKPLTIATNSLTACTNGTYCEQQLLISSGASGPNGFVVWTLTAGALPAGMNFSGRGQSQVNGTWRTGATGNAGWLWGTPTQSGSFPLTLQAEDGAHQAATVNLTLVVN